MSRKNKMHGAKKADRMPAAAQLRASGLMPIHSGVYTFSCFAEGNVGMNIEQNECAKRGENKANTAGELQKMADYYQRLGATTELYALKKRPEEPEALVLLVREGSLALSRHLAVTRGREVGANVASRALMEMRQLGVEGMDREFLHRSGKVYKKHARWNFNVGDRHQDADIPRGKNTLYNFTEMPVANELRQGINLMAEELGFPHMHDLLAEANVYYDGVKCGIGFHGDEERDKSPVCGVNMGEERKLCFRSFYKHRFFGEEIPITLKHGDMYFMSEKAVGIGWCRKTHREVIFRHRAGSAAYLAKNDKELARRNAKKDAKAAEKKRKREEAAAAKTRAKKPKSAAKVE